VTLRVPPRALAGPRLRDALDHAVLERHPALAAFADALGGTPLVALPRRRGEALILAKCEWDNPTGSIKDRTAFALVYDLLRREPRPGRVLEYSGGNLAVSLSRLCGALGLPNTLVMASFVPQPAIAAMRAQGTEVELVPKELGFWAVMERAYALADRHPDWSFLHQHRNRSNLWVHRTATGGELLADLDAAGVTRVDAWVASVGTGGTLIGVHDALRRRHPQARLVAVTPAELPYGSPLPPNGLPKYAGSGGLGCGRKQPFVEEEEARLWRRLVVSHPHAIAGIARLHEESGLRVGSSAAANWLAALRIAREIGPDGVVATVFPSAATEQEWGAACATTPRERLDALALEDGEEKRR
jgi:cysteine synthase A